MLLQQLQHTQKNTAVNAVVMHLLYKQSLGGVAQHARGERGGVSPAAKNEEEGGGACRYTSSTDTQSPTPASETTSLLFFFVVVVC